MSAEVSDKKRVEVLAAEMVRLDGEVEKWRAHADALAKANGELLAAVEDCYDAAKRHLTDNRVGQTLKRMQQARKVAATYDRAVTDEKGADRDHNS